MKLSTPFSRHPKFWFFSIALAGILTKINYHDLFSGWYLWVEDGIVFMSQAETLGLRSLWTPHQGYLHLFIRLVAWIATHFPLPYRPPLFFGGWMLSYLILLLFAFRAARALHFTLPSLLLLAFILPLQPTNKTGEVLFNLTNSQWILSTGWILWVLTKETPSPFSLIKGAGLLLLGLTGPLALVITPVLLLKIFLKKDFRIHLWIYLTLFSCALLQASLIFKTSEARILHSSCLTHFLDYLKPFSVTLLFGRKYMTILCSYAFWMLFIGAWLLHAKRIGPARLYQRISPEVHPSLPAEKTSSSAYFSIGTPAASVSTSASISQPDAPSPLPAVFLLLSAVFFYILSAEWSIGDDIHVFFWRRFVFGPRTFIFFSGIWLVDRYRKLQLLLTGLFVLICAIQFYVVQRPNPAFPSFVHTALYRDTRIPISLFVDKYPAPCFIHTPPTSGRLLPYTLHSPRELLVHRGEATYLTPLSPPLSEAIATLPKEVRSESVCKKWRLEDSLRLTGDSPSFSLQKEAPYPETQDLFVEITLNRSSAGWIHFFWSKNGTFSKKRSMRLWYPPGSISAEFACPYSEEGVFLRIDPLDSPGETTVRALKITYIPNNL